MNSKYKEVTEADDACACQERRQDGICCASREEADSNSERSKYEKERSDAKIAVWREYLE